MFSRRCPRPIFLPFVFAGRSTGYYNTRYGTPHPPTAAGSSPTDADGTATAAPITAPALPGARDPRLGLMRRSWFEGKKVLDVGCNEGHLTIAIVRLFRPRRMVGVDIDGYLIQRARRVSKLACISSGLRRQSGPTGSFD